MPRKHVGYEAGKGQPLEKSYRHHNTSPKEFEDTSAVDAIDAAADEVEAMDQLSVEDHREKSRRTSYDEQDRDLPATGDRRKLSARGNIGREMGDKYADMEVEEPMYEMEEVIHAKELPSGAEIHKAASFSEAFHEAMESNTGIAAFTYDELVQKGVDLPTKRYREDRLAGNARELFDQISHPTDEVHRKMLRELNEVLENIASKFPENAGEMQKEFLARFFTHAGSIELNDTTFTQIYFEDALQKIVAAISKDYKMHKDLEPKRAA